MRTTTTGGTLCGLLLGTALALGACGGGGGDDGGDDAPIDPIPEAQLLDDLEDGDGAIHEVEGRIGAWFVYNDGKSSNQTPPPDSDFVATEGGANGSMFAAGTKGSGYVEWGAGMGFDINNTGEGGPSNAGEKKAWDASAYTGVRFMAKGNVPLRVGILVSGAVAVADGGGCVAPTEPPAEGEDPLECGDSHGKTISLGSDWKEYKVAFAGLQQDGWGVEAAFDAATITSVMFDIGPDVEFDIAVDELGFY
jgi:hypothetical protein